MEFDGSILTRSISNMEPGNVGEMTQCPMTLHCQHCNTVLGDSEGICGDFKYLDSIICLKVTDDVVVRDPVKSTKEEGKMANCIYSPLKCGCCGSPLGRVIHSSPPCLERLRSLFLLNKANMRCYIFKSSSMVKASELQFNQKALGESMKEVKEQFEEHLEKMVRLKNRLVSGSRTRKSRERCHLQTA